MWPVSDLLPRRALISCWLGVAILVGGGYVLQHIHENERVVEEAAELMAVLAAGEQPSFEKHQHALFHMARSDRALGRMVTAANSQRHSVFARDQVIIKAANELSGIDLYRFLAAAAPLFLPVGGSVSGLVDSRGFVFPGVDLTHMTFEPEQKRAMGECLVNLSAAYSAPSLKSSVKEATSYLVGKRWETCMVPLHHTPTAPPLISPKNMI